MKYYNAVEGYSTVLRITPATEVSPQKCTEVESQASEHGDVHLLVGLQILCVSVALVMAP